MRRIVAVEALFDLNSLLSRHALARLPVLEQEHGARCRGWLDEQLSALEGQGMAVQAKAVKPVIGAARWLVARHVEAVASRHDVLGTLGRRAVRIGSLGQSC